MHTDLEALDARPSAPHATPDYRDGGGRATSQRGARSLNLLVLGAILSLAAILRFYALPQRGLIYWDEAKFALEGIRLEAELRWLVGQHVVAFGGKAIGTAKPSHALLIALSYALLGVHDYSPLLLDAAAGVVGVALTYRIATVLFDPLVGLLSALFLAVSEYDIIYSRSALSENDANALFLLGAAIWLGRSQHLWRGGHQPSRAAPLSAGLVLGLAFSTNYRLIVYIGALVLLDLAWHWYARGGREAMWRAPFWVCGLIVVPFAWQLVDVLARGNGQVLFRSEQTLQPIWYLRQALFQLHEGKQAMLHFSPLPYMEWFAIRQGWLMTTLVVCGLGLTVRLRSFPWITAAALVIVPYGVYVFAPFIVPRNLDPVLPFTSILAGASTVWLARMARSTQRSLSITVLVALVVAAVGTWMSWRLTAERSGFTRAAAYVEHHVSPGRDPRALTSSEIVVFYLSRGGSQCNTLRLRAQVGELKRYIVAGYRYAVLDHYSWKASRFVRDRMPHPARYTALGTRSIGENLIASENGHSPGQHIPTEYVDVFRLEPSLVPPGRINRPAACDLNKV